MSADHGSLTLVTGGAGYLGVPVAQELLSAGRSVRVLDVLLHGQLALASELEVEGAEVIRGDIRDPAARRRALDGVDAVVHLAAIVGDPACAHDPEGSQSINVDGTRALVQDATLRGVERIVFASTCSNYGRMRDPSLPSDEDGALAPLSVYARQKVAIERWLLSPPAPAPAPTCLRFATIYGVAPRMRFDLTVNEFTRELWADRQLDVFDELSWRPYVHVRDAARAVNAVLSASPQRVAGRVFNVGRSTENYRKVDIVKIIESQIRRGHVSYMPASTDPRDYKVSFARITRELAYNTTMTVPDGVAEIIAALDAGDFDDPFHNRYRNVP
ncbi:MAG TPA: NAD(P)-dependent oxidoreductase [Solirubrobacteraceae bacterium]|nr:NAD(P)-dependent oxidoreductase [Solirubrobacteraceae bacterium]